jgi:hypothetical protein
LCRTIIRQTNRSQRNLVHTVIIELLDGNFMLEKPNLDSSKKANRFFCLFAVGPMERAQGGVGIGMPDRRVVGRSGRQA